MSPRKRDSISCKNSQIINKVFGIIQCINWYQQRPGQSPNSWSMQHPISLCGPCQVHWQAVGLRHIFPHHSTCGGQGSANYCCQQGKELPPQCSRSEESPGSCSLNSASGGLFPGHTYQYSGQVWTEGSKCETEHSSLEMTIVFKMMVLSVYLYYKLKGCIVTVWNQYKMYFDESQPPHLSLISTPFPYSGSFSFPHNLLLLSFCLPIHSK